MVLGKLQSVIWCNIIISAFGIFSFITLMKNSKSSRFCWSIQNKIQQIKLISNLIRSHNITWMLKFGLDMPLSENIKEWRISLGGSYLAWPFPSSVAILTLCDHSHLAWQFLPHVTIPTLHGNSNLAWPFPPRVAILTSHDHSHLMWPFPTCMAILTSHGHYHLTWPFPPHVAILTSCDHSHLAW